MLKMPDSEAIDQEVEQNYDAFQQLVMELLQKQRQGQFALMRHKEIVEFFDSAGDARKYGDAVYKDDGLYSIQEVTSETLDLGYFSHGGAVADL